MPHALQERRHTLYGLAAFLSVIAVAAFILYCFPPELYSFYPTCPIHNYLHLECPGCGATRAFAALLHGDFAAALHLNALAVVVVLPLAALYAAISIRRALKPEPFRWPAIPNAATFAALAITASFTLIRNL